MLHLGDGDAGYVAREIFVEILDEDDAGCADEREICVFLVCFCWCQERRSAL